MTEAFRRRARASAAAWLAIVCSSRAVAQDPATAEMPAGSDPWMGVEEMIVTGAGGIAALIDAPTSVVAFDQGDLDAVGILNISDLADYTPNLEINSPYAASNPQIFIRGVGLQDSASNASGSVAVVVDDIYLSSPAGQLSSLFDIQSVEVLRGPQGALYGRNASAGVLRITTNPPVHEPRAGANVTYGRFNQLETDAFFNVPIVQDVLATRFAFKYVQRDPLGENRCYEDRDNPFPLPTLTRLNGTKCNDGMVARPRRAGNAPLTKPPKDTHDRQSWFARSVWLLEPADELKFVLNFHGGQNLGLAPQLQNRGTNPGGFSGGVPLPDLTTTGTRYVDYDTCHRFEPDTDCLRNDRFAGAGDPYSGDYSAGGKERLTLGGITLNTDWLTGPWTFTNVLGVEYNDREVVLDFDASPYREADAFLTDDAWQVEEEPRLVWNDDTGLELTVGGQFFYEEVDADNIVWNTAQSALIQDYGQTTVAAAGYFYLKYELTETIIFEGGARANYEGKEFHIVTAYSPFTNNTTQPPQAEFETHERADQVKPSGEAIMRWDPTDDIKLYARFSRGYKGQHFNGNSLSRAQPVEAVKAESVNSFELGWNTDWFDGLINWNGAGFYYDYENQQVYQLLASGVPVPVPVLINADDSRLLGLESDVTIAWEGIRWYNSVGIIFGEYSDFRTINEEVSVSAGGVLIQKDVKDFSGNSLVNAAETTLVGYLLYEWALPVGGTLTPRVDYRYKGRVFYTPENDSRIGADPRWIFDLRADYKTPAGDITIGGWIRNVMDEYYPVTAFDRKSRVGSILYVVSEPRTYGFTVSFNY